VVIGSGPAAHTAAIYASRAGRRTLLLEGAPPLVPGGQLTTTAGVENFPGFPEGVAGPELMERMREQSVRCGATVRAETATAVDLSRRPFRVSAGPRAVSAAALVVATGATARRLHFEGSEALWGRGISACAVCDGALPRLRGRPVAVVGGGDSAMEQACFLARRASRVLVVHRGGALRASAALRRRALGLPNVAVLWRSVVERAESDARGDLRRIWVGSAAGGGTTRPARPLDVAGLFLAVGHEPASAFLGGQVATDAEGYVATAPGSTATSVAGVFAAGDVADRRWRQAVTAAGTGCMAALEADAFLSPPAAPGRSRL